MPEIITSAIWVRNAQNNEWFDFLRLNFDSAYFRERKGVFVLWYAAGNQSKVIKVGSGNLSEQLKTLRVTPTVLQYGNYGTLKVSWIIANGNLREDQFNGVESFLFNLYSPLMGDKKISDPTQISPVIVIGNIPPKTQ